MVKIERTSVPPASLATEKVKASGRYNKGDVIAQLNADFHGKCYLCEINELQTVEVEHLKPHHGTDRERMFDWNNLFLSCGHCNSVKSDRFGDDILDCCKNEPEAYFNQELIDGHVKVTPLTDDISALRTAELITECFEKRNTGIRVLECDVRIKALQSTMTVLYRTLEEYSQSQTVKSERTLRGMLNRNYKFAGFTRTYVRLNLERYPDLAELIAI